MSPVWRQCYTRLAGSKVTRNKRELGHIHVKIRVSQMWFCAASCVAVDAHLWMDLSQTVLPIGDIVKVITESILFKCNQQSRKTMSSKIEWKKVSGQKKEFLRPKTWNRKTWWTSWLGLLRSRKLNLVTDRLFVVSSRPSIYILGNNSK
jgi:hypothetical protein